MSVHQLVVIGDKYLIFMNDSKIQVIYIFIPSYVTNIGNSLATRKVRSFAGTYYLLCAAETELYFKLI